MLVEERVRIVVYQAKQCDPKKCTALKLRRHGLVRIVPHTKFLPKKAVVLTPFSKIAFSPAERERVKRSGLAALDCSWEHVDKVLSGYKGKASRCLPFLIAGNPVNFGKPTKLTTAEALAGALYIAGWKEKASELLSVFKWGHTFLELNQERLESYSKARNSREVIELQASFIENMKRA